MAAQITALPTPPTRQDPTNFNDRADAFLAALPGFQSEANALSTEVNTRADNVQASDLAVLAATNITKWVSGTTYSQGAVVWSPINGLGYRRITASGSGTTDPSSDSTNYRQVNGTGNVSTDVSGNLGLGVTPSAWYTLAKSIDLSVAGAVLGTNQGASLYANSYQNTAGTSNIYKTTGGAAKYDIVNNSHQWYIAPSGTAGNTVSFTQAMTLDASGNLLVGTTTGNRHRLNKDVTAEAGIAVVTIGRPANEVFAAFSTSGGWGDSSASNSGIKVGRDMGTGRSINTSGTINQNGADYAEYEHNNGLIISKGSIVGFKSNGTLTLTFRDAIRFGIKSTDPGLVGGDNWGSEEKVGKRPEYPTDDAEQSIKDEYQRDLAVFEERLEAARNLVDRIAYSGKVPVNVTGATPGGYIIAAQAEDGSIIGEFVLDPDFAQYKKTVGRVNKLLPDGRCEVAVIVH